MAPGSGGRRRYRRLLVLLPETFRQRFGSDMEELFAARLEGAGSPTERIWIWLRAVTDILTHAALERLRPNGTSRSARLEVGTRFQDLRWAARTLRRSPFFASVAVLTLALGIGAATATFSLVDAVLLKDLPYRESDRLVTIWPEANFNNAMVREAVANMPAIESATGVSGWTLTLVGEGEPLEVDANRVSTNHFSVLGVQPELGRAFEDADGLPGQGAVVVLSHAFWVRVFGADPGVIGRTIQLSGADADTRTVLGVMPPDFRPVANDPEVWVPMTLDPATSLETDDTWYVNKRVARLAPGATVEQANDQVKAFAASVGERLSGRFEEDELRAASVRPYAAFMAGQMAPALWVALGAVSLVLLIACANVANLLLARGEAHARDLAVRAALGAERKRVIRMLLGESAILGSAGGALGIVLAYGLVRLVVATAPADFPRIGEVAVNGTMLLSAVGITAMATLVAGLIPALRVSRVDAIASLGGATRAPSARRGSRLTLTLVGGEVALAVVVIVGSGLMLRSLSRLTSVDVGLDMRDVVVMRASPPEGRYQEFETQAAYYDQVLDRLRAHPGVVAAGAIHLLPGTDSNWNFPVWLEGVDIPEGTPVPTVNFRITTPGYFATVGLTPHRGRLLQATDGEDAENVMVVNQAFVDRYWPGLDPIGRTIRIFDPQNDPFRVVGVVGNVRQHGFAQETQPEMYVTPPQWGWRVSLWLLVRLQPSDAPMAQAAALQDVVWSVDPDVPIAGLGELAGVFDQTATTTRFLTFVLGSFGALALLLGAVGVFAVTSYVVGRRIPEFGVRLALGSSRSSVLGTALLACARPITAGLLVGLAGAAGTSTMLRSVLFEIEPSDPVTFVMVGGTLLGVALLASLFPAWRASRLDPVRVLGAE